MDIEDFEEHVARRASGRVRKPTARAVEGAEQVHLQFNERVPPPWDPEEGELVWARFDRWPWWPAKLVEAIDRPWCQKSQGRWVYNCEFLGHGSEEDADYEYLPVAQLRPYQRHRGEMLGEAESGGKYKWVPSVSSAKSSDKLDEEYRDRFDAAVEHANRQGRTDLWPTFYVARAQKDDPTHDCRVGAEFRRMLDCRMPQQAPAMPQQATVSTIQLFWARRPNQRNSWWPVQILKDPPRIILNTTFVKVRFAGSASEEEIQSHLVQKTLPPRCADLGTHWTASQLSSLMTNPLYAHQPEYQPTGNTPEEMGSYRKWIARNKCDYFLPKGRKARREVKQIVEELIKAVEIDECSCQEIKKVLKGIVGRVIDFVTNGISNEGATIPTTFIQSNVSMQSKSAGTATTGRHDVATLRSPYRQSVQLWPPQQDLTTPVSYTDQLTLCLRKRGGLVSDRHKETAKLRLPAQQRALQRQQLADWTQPSAESVSDVNAKLRGAFGARTFRPGTEHALNALIGTILTQNTSDILSSRSFSQLHREFDSAIHGPKIRAADIDEIADLLAASGLQNSKARRIRQLLRSLHDENDGSTSLEFLKNMSRQEIHRYLSRFLGVGVKTIACIGLYNLGARDFAVDTHLYRFAVRFGWVPTFMFTDTPPVPAPAPTQMGMAAYLVAPPPMVHQTVPQVPVAVLPPPSERRAAKILTDLLSDPPITTTSAHRIVDSASMTAAATPATAPMVSMPCELSLVGSSREEMVLSRDESDVTVDYDSDATEEADETDARMLAGVEVDSEESSSSCATERFATVERKHCPDAVIEQQTAQPNNSQTPQNATAEGPLDSALVPAVSAASSPSQPSRSSSFVDDSDASQPAASNADGVAATPLGDIEDLGALGDSVSGTTRFMRIPPINEVQNHVLKRFEVSMPNNEFCFNAGKVFCQASLASAKETDMTYTKQAEKLDHAALFELHANLRTLGMRLCHASNPRCDICPLADTCEHGKRVLGSEAAQAAGSAARKPKGEASQPWMKFHKWGEEEAISPTQAASGASTDQPTTAAGETQSVSRRVYKGLQLLPVVADDVKSEACTALPAVNALCHARGAGDYCQIESWEVRPTMESLQGHSTVPISEQMCIGMQRLVGPETKSRLMAKYFEAQGPSGNRKPLAGTESPNPIADASAQAEHDRGGRFVKVLELSQHDRTSRVEAAHAARIVRKRRAAGFQEFNDNRSVVAPCRRPVRRRLNFDTERTSSAATVAACSCDYRDQAAEAESAAEVGDLNNVAGVSSFLASGRHVLHTSIRSPSSMPTLPCHDVATVLRGIVAEIERRADAPKLYILTDFFEEVSMPPQSRREVERIERTTTIVSATTCVGDGRTSRAETHGLKTATATACSMEMKSPNKVRRWIQALRVYHNTDLWAPAGFDNDSNFERNEVWVSLERVLLPVDGNTVLRRRTIDFSTASPPCHNYVCHSMIKPHSRGSTLHGLEEWSIKTGLFTKSKDWNAIHSKWSDSSLVLYSHRSHNEVRKMTGLGHQVKPQPDRPVWLPAAERRRRKRQESKPLQSSTPSTHCNQHRLQLPEQWEEHFTTQHHVEQGRCKKVGQAYYFNRSTKESRWKRPDNHLSGRDPVLEENGQLQTETTSVEQPFETPVVSSGSMAAKCVVAVGESTTVESQERRPRRQQLLDTLLPAHAMRATKLEQALEPASQLTAADKLSAGLKRTTLAVRSDAGGPLKQQKLTMLAKRSQSRTLRETG